MKRQFTATCYVLENNKVLLLYHRKLKKWLPPGGHIEPNETPPEAVHREVFEETGLKITLIKQENIWIERWNASSFQRPWMCLLQEIPTTPKEDAHQHMDFIYLGEPCGGRLKENDAESNGLRWFCWEELCQLAPDEELFVETLQTIELLLSPSVASV